MDTQAVLAEIDADELAALIEDIGIPPRPSLLVDMQAEVQRDEPRLKVMADIAGSDAAMSAALIKVANSPLMGLRRRAETVQDAFMLMGFNQCHLILTEITLRELFPANNAVLAQFWDRNTHRAQAMTVLARRHGIGSVAVAHTLGLFVDIGMPVMLARWAEGERAYTHTLAEAALGKQSLTAVERRRHALDHAQAGAVLARSWGVSQAVLLAIWLHHEPHRWEVDAPVEVQELMALCALSEHIVDRYDGVAPSAEWQAGGELALHRLNMDERTLDEWTDEIHDLFGAQP